MSLGRRCPSGRIRSGEMLFPDPHPPSETAPLPESEGYSLDDGFCDSALRLRAE